MVNSAIGKIFDVALDAVNLFRFWVVIDEFERGLILRLGKFHKNLEPGVHFRLPFNIDKLLFLNIRKQTSDSWEMTLTSVDGKTITLSFDMVIEVNDVEKALLKVESWKSVGYTSAKIILSGLVAKTPAKSIMQPEFTHMVVTVLNLSLDTFGIHVTEFGITDKCYSKAYRFFKGASH